MFSFTLSGAVVPFSAEELDEEGRGEVHHERLARRVVRVRRHLHQRRRTHRQEETLHTNTLLYPHYTAPRLTAM